MIYHGVVCDRCGDVAPLEPNEADAKIKAREYAWRVGYDGSATCYKCQRREEMAGK